MGEYWKNEGKRRNLKEKLQWKNREREKIADK